MRYDASHEKKKKGERKIIGSDKRSNSSREREALLHCNMLPGTPMHGFGCLHSRKKKSNKEVQRSAASLYDRKRKLIIQD